MAALWSLRPLRVGWEQRDGPGLGVEPALQDEDGGDLVDEVTMLAAVMAGGVKGSVGLGGGEALIPEVDGKGNGLIGSWLGGVRLHEGGQLRDEAVDALGLPAVTAGEQKGVADDDAGAAVAAGEAQDGALVAARLDALERHEGLGDAQSVRERDANAACADVKAEPGLGCGAHAGDDSGPAYNRGWPGELLRAKQAWL